MRPDVWAIVVAGGSGSRFGRPKQFDLLADRPVVAWSVDAVRRVAGGVVLVLPSSDVAAADADPSRRYGADVVVAGGASRSASVRCGLAALPPQAAVVVIHDAARPMAPASLFDLVVAPLVVAGDRPDGVICGLPVADTLKRVTADGDVVDTVERSELVAVQTPQAFDVIALRRAHAGGGEATDDAAMIERAGGVVRVVPGDARNVKLTTPADLAYLEHLLSLSGTP